MRFPVWISAMALAILTDVPVVCRQVFKINTLMEPQLLPSKSWNKYLHGATSAFQIFELLPWWCHICFLPNLWIITVVVPHLLHSESLNYYRGGATLASFQIFELLPWWCHTCFIPNLWIITVVVPHLLHSKYTSVCHSLIILPLWHAERQLCFYLKLMLDAEDSHTECVFHWQIIPSIVLCSWTLHQLLCMSYVKDFCNYKWNILSGFPCTFRYFTFS